jgi:hypothetical protein
MNRKKRIGALAQKNLLKKFLFFSTEGGQIVRQQKQRRQNKANAYGQMERDGSSPGSPWQWKIVPQ